MAFLYVSHACQARRSVNRRTPLMRTHGARAVPVEIRSDSDLRRHFDAETAMPCGHEVRSPANGDHHLAGRSRFWVLASRFVFKFGSRFGVRSSGFVVPGSGFVVRRSRGGSVIRRRSTLPVAERRVRAVLDKQGLELRV